MKLQRIVNEIHSQTGLVQMENANSGQNIGGLFQRSRGDERKPVELWREKGGMERRKKLDISLGFLGSYFCGSVMMMIGG